MSSENCIGSSYHRPLFAARRAQNYDVVYERALDELSGKVELGQVMCRDGHGKRKTRVPVRSTFSAESADADRRRTRPRVHAAP